MTYFLPLVARVERGVNLTAEDAYIATAKAVASFLENGDPNLQEWLNSDYRKIVRRARGVKWDAVASEAITVERSGAHMEVAVFKLYETDKVPSFLSSLQVSGLEIPSHGNSPKNEEGALNILLNNSLNMSTGKKMAQVGHAAQMFYLNSPDTKLWLAANKPVKIQSSLPEDANPYRVKDNGLTEIPAGSITAYAW